jgi:hypothetical protein
LDVDRLLHAVSPCAGRAARGEIAKI